MTFTAVNYDVLHTHTHTHTRRQVGTNVTRVPNNASRFDIVAEMAGIRSRAKLTTATDATSVSAGAKTTSVAQDLCRQGRKPGTKCGGRPVQGVWGTEVPQKLKQFWISICIILT